VRRSRPPTAPPSTDQERATTQPVREAHAASVHIAVVPIIRIDGGITFSPETTSLSLERTGYDVARLLVSPRDTRSSTNPTTSSGRRMAICLLVPKRDRAGM
jgi:hypothetical protein